MIVKIAFNCCLILLLAGCHSVDKTNDYSTLSEVEIRKVADSLARTFIIVDGHVDLPWRLSIKNFRLEREYMSIPVSSDEGDFDYERAKKGGLDAPFMSIYIPSANQQKPDMEIGRAHV